MLHDLIQISMDSALERGPRSILGQGGGLALG